MAYWQNIKCKSDAFWTHKDKEILKKNAEASQKWADAQTKEEEYAAKEIMRETHNALTDAAFKALALYIKDIKGDYDRLLSDAKDMIAQIEPDMVIEETCDAYRTCLQERIIEELRGNGAYNEPNTNTQELEIYNQVKARRDKLEKVNERMLFTAISAEVRHFYLYEQYEAARYAFENQSKEGSIYPKRTIEEYRAFTVKIAELADVKIKQIIDEQGGYYEIIAEYYNIQRKADPATHITRRKKANNYISPVNMPAAFHTPNSFISNEFPFWQKEFYKENTDGQLTFLPDAGRLPFNIAKTGAEPVNIYVALNYEGDITEDGKTTISYNKARIAGFDLAVLDAICSFMEHGTDKIYVSAIDNLLKGGKTQGNKVSKKRQERILLALRKLSGTRIYLDVKNDLNVKYGNMFASGIYDGAMLEYEGLELTTYAGIETYVFHVKDLPAIYKYSKAKGNIVQFPTYLLDTGDRAEENLIPLKKELLKHITLINKRIYSNHNISISNLYKRADVPEPTGANRKQKSRDIAKFKNWLDYWKVTNYIKGFSVQGGTITIKPNYAPIKETNKSME